MPTTYTEAQISEIIKQFTQHYAKDFDNDAGSIKSRLRVSMERGETATEMLERARTTVGQNNPEFVKRFANAVQRLSIP